MTKLVLVINQCAVHVTVTLRENTFCVLKCAACVTPAVSGRNRMMSAECTEIQGSAVSVQRLFYWKWSMCWYLIYVYTVYKPSQIFFPPVNNRDLCAVKDEQHGVSSTANSQMGLVFLPLQCRREWNSGLGIDWTGPECSLPPLICYLEVLWRRKETVRTTENIKRHKMQPQMLLNTRFDAPQTILGLHLKVTHVGGDITGNSRERATLMWPSLQNKTS